VALPSAGASLEPGASPAAGTAQKAPTVISALTNNGDLSVMNQKP
jgi:hypothetical protein